MKMYSKIKNLQTNQKIILGALVFLFLNPLFFAYLTIFAYKEIKNKVLNGVVTLALGFITIFSAMVWFALIFGEYESDTVTDQEQKTEVQVTPTPEIKKPEVEMTFKVLSVTDGDTFRIDYYGESTPIRLIGADAPEINHQSEPVQCFGPEAKEYIEKLIKDKYIKLEKEPKDNNTDRFDRLLRYVFLEDGTNITEKAIKEGYLLESTYTEGYKYQELYKQSQQQAKTNQLGFWSPTTCNGNVYTGTYKDPAKTTPTPIPTIAPTPMTQQNTGSINTYVAPAVQQQTNTGGYVSNCSKSCTAMVSCDEAYFQLNTCGCSARDGDKDGIPCESLCR